MLQKTRVARRTKNQRRAEIAAQQVIKWPRADKAALAGFDPNTKTCTMNCGGHREDPRCNKERKLLCDDCEKT